MYPQTRTQTGNGNAYGKATYRKSDAATAYRHQSILTASPAELVVMLFDGIRKDLMQAAALIEKKDVAETHKKLINAQEIISELMNALDLSLPLAQEILPLYEFLYREFVRINTTKDASVIPPVLAIVDELRDTWYQIAVSAKGSLTIDN